MLEFDDELLLARYSPEDEDEDDEKDEKDEKGEKKAKRGMDVMSKLLKTRTILVSKGVDDKLAASVITQLTVLESDDADKPITIVVNSPGGSADSGFAILDYLRFVRPPVRSIVCGICASAAVMIHLGSKKGMRFCTPNSRFLLHQPSMRAQGQASDLEILSKEIERMKEQYNQIVADETGQTLKQVEKDVHRDFWLPAKDALKYGLVDKVVTSRKEIE
ncbi:ATP-dependent Clp protease proteolytic subunit [bacterium]|nr:MAG: ATP-dependent Clp protease proteolytic subunit [bacterium]RIK65353.1 MAG: ATP-dependent Clp protease proteolytic subunit [Planctomycetota bacterium]